MEIREYHTKELNWPDNLDMLRFKVEDLKIKTEEVLIEKTSN